MEKQASTMNCWLVFYGRTKLHRILPLLFRENHTPIYGFPLVICSLFVYLCTMKEERQHSILSKFTWCSSTFSGYYN